MKQIISVFGTRPEIIKMAPIIPLLDKEFSHSIIYTSQHYSKEMADQFFEELGVRKPDVFLHVNSSEHSKLEEAILLEMKKSKAGYVIVYGDTNSTLAAARAAKKCGKKIIHLEAGLRSYDNEMPEENNRIETDRLSEILFPPTELSKEQLAKEGITKNVFVVGNLVVDACNLFAPRAPAEKGNYILLTAHRQENVDNSQKLSEIISALSGLGNVIFPVHPRTRKRLEEFGMKMPANVKLLEPVGYIRFLGLLKGAKLVITDSGGVQEEAATLHIPCLTIRAGNERWEAIIAGSNFLVSTDPKQIQSYARAILNSPLGERMRNAENPFGDGKTAQRIADILKRMLR